MVKIKRCTQLILEAHHLLLFVPNFQCKDSCPLSISATKMPAKKIDFEFIFHQ